MDAHIMLAVCHNEVDHLIWLKRPNLSSLLELNINLMVQYKSYASLWRMPVKSLVGRR